MTLRFSRIIPLVCVLFFLVIAVLSLYHVSRGMDPESRADFLEWGLARVLHREVSIVSAEFSFRDGVEIMLEGVQIGCELDFELNADTVEMLFKPRDFIFGDFVPEKLTLHRPKLRISQPLPCSRDGDVKHFPEIHVNQGLLIVGTDDDHYVLAEGIEGLISKKSLKISGLVLGGRADVRMEKIGGLDWRGEFVLDGAAIDRIDPSWSGVVALDVRSSNEKSENSLACRIDITDLTMPWWEESMDRVGISFNLAFHDERLLADDIVLETPLMVVSGEATLDGLEKGKGDSSLNVSLCTSEFDYETFIGLLPVHLFPEWLSRLLTRQIRGGTTTITDMRYSGPLEEALSRRSLLQGLVIEGLLLGQSFSAGHDESRIENISGRAKLAGSSLAFRHLSGGVGSSTIEDLEMVFHDILSSDMLLSLNLELDMKLVDFATAWSAAMVPASLHGLLDPFDGAESGRIKGWVETITDMSRPEPTLIKGMIALEDCTFSWRGNRLESVWGLATKERWESPLEVSAEGMVEGIRVGKVDLLFPDIFGKKPYDISVVLFDIPLLSDFFSLGEESRIMFSGKGMESLFEGCVSLYSEGLHIAGNIFVPKEGAIEGQGVARINMGEEFEIVLEDLNINMAAGDLTLGGRILRKGGSIDLQGRLDLACIDGKSGNSVHPVDGLVGAEATLQFGEAAEDGKVSSSGKIACDLARLLMNDETIILDGEITAREDGFSTSRLFVGYGGVTVTMAGRLAPGDPWEYHGSIEMENLVTEEGVTYTDKVPLFDLIDIYADLTVKGLDFRGLFVESLRSKLIVRQGGLSMESMECILPRGTVAGSIRTNREGVEWLNVTFDFKDENVVSLLRVLSQNGDLMDGSIRLDGWLRGYVDSLDGRLEFEATGGSIKRYTFLSKIFTVTNVYKLMTNGKVGFMEDGFVYDSISFTADVREGTAHFSDFRLESPSIQMSAVGKFQITDRTIDAVVGIQPLETVDRVIGLVPVVNWILLGDDQRLIVVSAKVQGDVRNPSITIAPLDSLSDTVSGVLMQTLRLPVDIVKSPKKVIPGMQ